MKKSTGLIVSVVVSFIFSFSVHAGKDKDPPVKAPPYVEDTRLFLSEKCLEPKAEAAVLLLIAAAVAPKLIESGVAFISDYIKEYSDNYSATYTASVSDYLFFKKDEHNAAMRYDCLVVARGKFGSSAGKPAPNDPTGKYWEALSLTDTPDFLLEAQLVYGGPKQNEANGIADIWRIHPLLLSFKNPAAVHGTVKDLVVTFSVDMPGTPKQAEAPISTGTSNANHPKSDQDAKATSTQKPSAGTSNHPAETNQNPPDDSAKKDGEKDQLQTTAPNSFSPIAFYKMSPGTLLNSALIGKTASTDWLNIPSPSVATMQNTGIDEKIVPITLKVTVTETDKGNGVKLLVKIADAISQSKSDVAKAATKSLTDKASK